MQVNKCSINYSAQFVLNASGLTTNEADPRDDRVTVRAIKMVYLLFKNSFGFTPI